MALAGEPAWKSSAKKAFSPLYSFDDANTRDISVKWFTAYFSKPVAAKIWFEFGFFFFNFECVLRKLDRDAILSVASVLFDGQNMFHATLRRSAIRLRLQNLRGKNQDFQNLLYIYSLTQHLKKKKISLKSCFFFRNALTTVD